MFVSVISTFFFLIYFSVAATAHAAEPIAFVGHGAMFDQNGKEIQVTPEFLENTLKYYVDDLYRQAGDEQKARFDAVREKLTKGRKWDQQNSLYASAELADWLIKEVKPRHGHVLQGKINLIRSKLRYQFDAAGQVSAFKPNAELQQLFKDIERKDKIDRDVIGFSTMQSGQAYIDECAASGVPIPPAWNSDGSTGWNFIGALSDAQEFISVGSEARVYKYDSAAPEGTCIALPRVSGNGSGSTAGLLGIICMGKMTSKVCFWDNQQSDMGFPVDLGDTYPLLDFAGGAELLGGSGGVCTTCHSGENPYVTHPGTALDFGGLFADNWYDPQVHPDWPQNAGPTNILDAVPSAGDCTSCHYQGGPGGRFPKLSTEISGYCSAVLNQAIGRTMPSDAAYQPHIDALNAMCSQTPTAQLRVDSIIDYREVELGFAFKKALVIHNDGDAALTVSVSILTPAADPNRAQWSELNEITPVVIQPGDDPIILPQVYEPQALGAHTIQMEVSSDDPSTPVQVVTLTGIGINPTPIDTVLVLDRSGSMDDPAGDRKKIHAMRDAAMLYTDLQRLDIGATGTGDKLGFVKYNASNSVYMNLDFIDDAKKNAIAASELSDGALNDAARLFPDGRTGIGGAMQRAADEIGGPVDGRHQVMVVLTDGKENESPYIADVLGDIRSGNTDLQMYSVGLGFDIEPTKLQSITNMGSEGYHQVVGSLSNESLFDLENFYFKIFSNATGMDLVVDPTHVVNLQNPDPVTVDTARIISSDRSANFLVLDNPALRGFYDLEFVSPTGSVMTTGASVGGIPIQEMSRHTYRVFRIVFPDIAQESEYVGDWILRLKPNGKWSREAAKEAMAKSQIQPSETFDPIQGMVPVGFSAAVDSNYKLAVEVLPSSALPGAEVRLTGSLSDRGWPAVDGKIDVKVTSPNNTNYSVKLYDDGTHGDVTASDGTWTNRFVQTGVPGVYKFLFQSVGHNERGELAPREASRYVTLMQPESTPQDDPSDCIPCQLFRALLLLMLVLLLWLWYCACWRKRG
ncbi:MAG: VWA domain-containing protein [Pseudomonadota bacterium]|nr:MAG: VWA domain-containing protein [Pseudomonadota bacterium]